jgi:glycosyltransferase involved in cell wall biosynthesis
MDSPMPAVATVSIRPTVSAIVPARNEEACLHTCLDSLLAQNAVNVEVIVVDDHSTDHTHEIASSMMSKMMSKTISNSGPQTSARVSLRLIEAGPLPPGWTGKNNAVTAGSAVARGDWLLFTDADTIHLPGSLKRAIDEARRRDAALLSYSPGQIVETFFEKAVMPVIFAELAASFRPSQVSDPKSSAAAANGQYILITREAYDAVGGHAAIAGELLEDVALARAVKRSGRKIFFRYAADAVRTRMYRTFAQLREGWIKNLALLFPAPARLAALRAIEFILIVATFVISISAALRGHWRAAAVPATLAVILYALFLARIRRAHFRWDANLLALLGLPLFAYLLLRSKSAHANGSVCWKGRTYSEKGRLLATGH